jgi:hypothetical protein
MGLVLVGALPWARAVNPWLAPDQRTMTAADYPEAATSFLVSHRYGQHVFNDHPWGSYLDWQAWPRYQPMIDPAIEIHPADAWLDILTLAQGHASWEELADRYGVDVLLLRRGGENLLIDAANRSPRWQAVYHDDLAVIYIRSAQAEAPYAAS